MRIGIVGGTGREGRGLAANWSKNHDVFLGSRSPERAAEAAAKLGLQGGSNAEACDADVVLLAVPYSAHAATLTALEPHLRGKVLIDITIPLKPPKVRTVHLPQGQSAALEAQALLPETTVVSTLHHVSSEHLATGDIDCDVLVCCDDKPTREQIMGLIEDLGVRALDAGRLRNSIALEALTPVLSHMNKRYKSTGTGLRITGL